MNTMNDRLLLPPGLEVPDGQDITSRRAYMAAVFRFCGPYADEMMAAARAEAERTLCVALYEHNVTAVGHEYFEHIIDVTIWNNWLSCGFMLPCVMSCTDNEVS